MSVVEREIRNNEGTVVSPAPSQNKQGAYNVGVLGLEDRTQHIYKDSGGTEHIFITKDEIESLIALGVPVSSSNVYIVPTSNDNFIELLEGALVYNIWAQGIDIDLESYTINPISSKNIYAPSNTDLVFGDAVMNWSWPASGTDDINISFYTDINDTDQNQDNIGGFNGSPKYRLRFKGINFPVFNNTVATTDFKSLYEKNTGFAFSSSNLDNFLTLWSGQETFGRDGAVTAVITSKTEDSAFLYESLKVGDVHGNNVELALDITSGTEGVPIHKIQFNDGADALARVALRTLETGVVVPALQAQIDEIDVFNVDVDSHVGIGTLPYDWKTNIQSEDLGQTGSRAIDGDGILHDGQNFYIDSGGDYRFKVGVPATWTQTGGGLTITYTNGNTPLALGIITRVELSRVDANGNISYNGATIPETLSSNYNYEFNGVDCVMTGINSTYSRFEFKNGYYDGSSYRSLSNTGHVSYAKLTTTTYELRRSTIASTVLYDTMTMTTVITPT